MKRSKANEPNVISKKIKTLDNYYSNSKEFSILHNHWKKIIGYLQGDWLTISKLMSVNKCLLKNILTIFGNQKPTINKAKVDCWLRFDGSNKINIAKLENGEEYHPMKILYKLCPLGCLLVVQDLHSKEIFVANICNTEVYITEYLRNNYQILRYSKEKKKYIVGEIHPINPNCYLTCRYEYFNKMNSSNSCYFPQNFKSDPERIYHWDPMICEPYFKFF